MVKSIIGILLAAGISQRFGSDKRRASVGQTNESMLLHCFKRLSAVVEQVCVVVQEEDELATQVANLGAQLVLLPHSQGIGQSIAAAVLASHNASAWLISLADKPFIQIETMQRVIVAGERPEDIVVPVWRDAQGRETWGHPVLFGADYLDELSTLSGTQHARAIIQRHLTHTKFVPVQDEGVVRDVDYPDELIQFRHLL